MNIEKLNDKDLEILIGFQETVREKLHYPFLIVSITDLMETNSAIIESEKLSAYKYLDNNQESHNIELYDLLPGLAEYEKGRNIFWIFVQMMFQIVFVILLIMFTIKITF